MFRLTRYLKQLRSSEPLPPARQPSGPVVIWNLIRRCNLTCEHCYTVSANRDFPGELATQEVYAVMDDLAAFGVPVLILSGGEPLMRPDIFDISRRAKAMGFYVGLSTNGTLIGEHNIETIADIGYDYVGISLDGLRDTHDHFRKQPGSFDQAFAGMRWCRDYGIKVGSRFTLTGHNQHDFGPMLDLLEAEGIPKFYLSHLNYAGRGNRNRGTDAVHRISRWAMDTLMERCWEELESGREREYVTGNNDADGAYLLLWVQRNLPEKTERARILLERWGGNASGLNIANIDNLGNIHPDTFFTHYPLGNVRQRPFSAVWSDTSDPVLARLKQQPRPVTGRCGACRHLAICGGNTRVRAWQLTGDHWAEDPGCYLTDTEIGLGETVPVTAMED